MNQSPAVNPERDLAAEVLRAAVYEATRSPLVGGNGITAAQVQQARAFCLNETGPWVEARQLWCDALGVLPELFRRHALRAISDPKPARCANKKFSAVASAPRPRPVGLNSGVGA